MKYARLTQQIFTAIVAIVASAALSYGWYGTALFFSLWTIGCLLELHCND
jgi:hypothetical protein